MPIEAVKIPQNVNVEDRIVGPITLRQLIILLITGGISYALWTGAKSQLGVASIPVTVICWLPALIGAAFAFVKIQGISLLRLILLVAERTQKPTTRSWGPRRGISINFSYSTAVETTNKPVAEPHHEKIDELSELLDRGPITATEEYAKQPTNEEPMHPVNPAKIATSTAPDGALIDDLAPKVIQKSLQGESTTAANTRGFMDILPPTFPSSPFHA